MCLCVGLSEVCGCACVGVSEVSGLVCVSVLVIVTCAGVFVCVCRCE